MRASPFSSRALLAFWLAACGRTPLVDDPVDARTNVDASFDDDAGLPDARRGFDGAVRGPYASLPPYCPHGYTVEAREAALPVDILLVVEDHCKADASSGTPLLNCFGLRIRDQLETRFLRLWNAMSANDIDTRVVQIITHGGEYSPSTIPGSAIPELSDYVRIRYPHPSDAWGAIFSVHADISGLLRPDARLHIVIVTDGQPSMLRAEDFLQAFHEWSGRPFSMHAVVSPQGIPTAANPHGACVTESGQRALSGGGEYLRAAELTGGTIANVCTGDWDALVERLSERVLVREPLPCSLALPLHPEGRGFYVPERLEVIARVPDSAGVWSLPLVRQCTDGLSGWSYASGSQRIDLCPSTCERLNADGARLSVLLGCDE